METLASALGAEARGRPSRAGRLLNVKAALARWTGAPQSAQLAFDANPLAMWFYDLATLAILAVNDAAARLYGYGRDELRRMAMAELLAPGESPVLLTILARTPEGVAGYGSCRHRRWDGSLVDVEMFGRTVRLGDRTAGLIVALDASNHVRERRERRRAEEALAQSEVSFRSIVENAVFGMYRSTRDGRFSMVNQTLVEMLGYDSAGELLAAGISHDIWLNPEVRTRLLADGGPIDVFASRETEWRRKDGSVVTVRINGHAIRSDRGETVAYEAIVEDVTERHALEEQLRQAQKMEAIGQLAGGIAHDFNNLLTAILATLEIVKAEHGGNTALMEELDTVRTVSERGAALIRKLLAFGRRQRLDLRTVDLSSLVAESLQMLRRVVPAHIDIKVALDTKEMAVRADAGAIEQILLNLITNARDAMPGGGTALVQTYRTELDETYCASQGWDAPGSYVVLAVSDTGIGMDAQTRRRVFEPFFTTKPTGVGTGLGLAMVYGLAKQHGGFAHVYSEPGCGTSVKIYLPAAKEAPRAGVVAPPVVVQGGTETILLAEDEFAVRRAARRVLEKHGYTVVEAADGVEALERYREHAGGVHLVLSDVMMPRMTGPQLVAGLRSEGCGCPVLFMSGYTARDIEETTTLGPGTSLLTKPWTITDLLCQVRATLDEQPSAVAWSAP